jgi:hypothetical protein
VIGGRDSQERRASARRGRRSAHATALVSHGWLTPAAPDRATNIHRKARDLRCTNARSQDRHTSPRRAYECRTCNRVRLPRSAHADRSWSHNARSMRAARSAMHIRTFPRAADVPPPWVSDTSHTREERHTVRRLPHARTRPAHVTLPCLWITHLQSRAFSPNEQRCTFAHTGRRRISRQCQTANNNSARQSVACPRRYGHEREQSG